MTEFKYKIGITQNKDEYDKGLFSLDKPILEWLHDYVGDGHIKGFNAVTTCNWTKELSYPGPHLISDDYYFKNRLDAMLFALKWGK